MLWIVNGILISLWLVIMVMLSTIGGYTLILFLIASAMLLLAILLLVKVTRRRVNANKEEIL